MTSSRGSASDSCAKRPNRAIVVAALGCALVAVVLFQFFGNSSRGYINTASLFYWWGFQWVNPSSETEHGWLILGLSAWLLWRGARTRTALEKGEGRTEKEGRIENLGRTTDQGRKRTKDEGLRTKDFTERRGEGEASELHIANQPSPANPQPQTPNSKPQTGGAQPTQNSKPKTQNLAPAAVALVAALALHAVGFAAQQARISIVALLLFAWGVMRLAGGPRWGRAAAFPLVFMLFAIPFNALDSIGFWLRVWVVDASAAIARAAGIGVLQNGTQLVAPDGTYNYDVAAACSGIRSLTAMTALSLLTGYLNFSAWSRRIVVLLLCFPLVYVGNVARILAIVFAAHLGGPKWGDVAHEVMGYGIFVIVLGGVFGGVALIRKWWGEESSAESSEYRVVSSEHHAGESGGSATVGEQIESEPRPLPAPHSPDARYSLLTTRYSAALPTTRYSFATRYYTLAGIVVGLALAEMAFLHHLSTLPPRGGAGVVLGGGGTDPVELPGFIGTEWMGRRTDVSKVEREILPPDTGFSRKLYVSLSQPQRPVFLSIVLSGRDRTSIHRPELCLVGQGWSVVERVRHSFKHPGQGAGAFPATLLRVRREVQTPRGKAVVPELTAYWFVSSDAVEPTHARMLLHDAWNRVFHARVDRWAYVLMQTDASDGEAAALARMQAVLDGTLPAFQRATR